MSIFDPVISQIGDSLFVANLYAIEELSENSRFDEVVTVNYCGFDGRPVPEASTTELEFMMDDGGNQNHATFTRAVDHVVQSIEDGDDVVVHCQAAVNRSPAVCMAAYAAIHDVPMEEAYELVSEKHPRTKPYPGTIHSVSGYLKSRNSS